MTIIQKAGMLMVCVNCKNSVSDGVYCCICGSSQELTDFKDLNLEELFLLWKKKHYPRLCENTREINDLIWKKFYTIKSIKVINLRTYHFQDIIDKYDNLSKSYLLKIKQLCNHLMKFAIKRDIISFNYAEYIETYSMAETNNRDIFTDDEIKKIFSYSMSKNRHWKTAQEVLMLIYSGFRPSELFSLKRNSVNLEFRYFHGGGKTEAGTNRIVPIANTIYPFVLSLCKKVDEISMVNENHYLFVNVHGHKVDVKNWRRRQFYPLMNELKINMSNSERKITPYSTRHTFASLCYRAQVRPEILVKIIGHTNYKLTQNTYIHNQINDFTKEIIKLDKTIIIA